MRPPQSGKAREIAVGGHELTAGFNRQCRKPGVGDQIPPRAGLATESLEDLPVPDTGSDQHRIRLSAKGIRKPERRLDRCWRMKDSRVGDDPEKAAQHLLGHGIGFIRPHQRLEPRAMCRMLRGVLPEGIDEDVDINQSQAEAPLP